MNGTDPIVGHTPTPWRIVSERDDELKVKGPQGEWVADCADGFWSDEADGWLMAEESAANAALIVRAVNAHAELVEALEHLLKVRTREGVKPQSRDAAEAKARALLTKLRGQAQ